jgi:hypothetical protein
MGKIDKAIEAGDTIMLNAEEDFATSMRDIEKAIMREVMKLFDSIDVKEGKLQNSEQAIKFLASMDKRIDAALKNAGYNDKVKDLLRNFDSVRRNNLEVQSLLNKREIPYSSLNAVTKLEVENSIEKLLGSGISADFKIPIREALYRNITLGSTIQEARATIQDYLTSNDGKDSKLLRYTTQVARDSIRQYDGVIQKTISNELGLKDFIYVGNIITDSRCQCVYWVKKTKLNAEELINEIKIAVEG